MPDAADRVTDDDQRAMEQLEERLRQERIAASFRLHDPSKPVECIDCGNIVPRERLDAFPRTGRCTACATEIERRYRSGDPR